MDGDINAKAKIVLSGPSNSEFQSLYLDAIQVLSNLLVISNEFIDQWNGE